MRKLILLAAGMIAATPLALRAQMAGPAGAPKTWVSAYGLMYTGVSNLDDPDTSSRWRFDDNAFGFGASLQRQLGTSLMIGVDASVARPEYERRDLTTDIVAGRGTASIATAMATGRYGYAGGGAIGFYLDGGIGMIAYRLEDLGFWNTDFALQAGTGLEYRFDRNKAVALEWGRTWGYHEEEDIGDGNQTHSRLKLALRLGF
ncbi:MAG TPA: outer membrane beta-barrel protein [Longimicrobiales bacterium]